MGSTLSAGRRHPMSEAITATSRIENSRVAYATRAASNVVSSVTGPSLRLTPRTTHKGR